MDQIIGMLTNYLVAHPQILALMIMFIVVHTAVKAFVDSLVSSRADWDKTPMVDETWYEKALTIAGRVLTVTGKMAAYLVGFRSKIEKK